MTDRPLSIKMQLHLAHKARQDKIDAAAAKIDGRERIAQERAAAGRIAMRSTTQRVRRMGFGRQLPDRMRSAIFKAVIGAAELNLETWIASRYRSGPSLVAQDVCLKIMVEHCGISVSETARALGRHHSTILSALDRMASRPEHGAELLRAALTLLQLPLDGGAGKQALP